MTSTPVKNVDSIMNYVGKTGVSGKNGKDDSLAGFGDFMKNASKASSGQKTDAVTTEKKPIDEASHQKQISREDKVRKPEVKSSEAPRKADEEQAAEALQEAGDKAVSAVADEFNLSEEEVVAAMERLGLTPMDLLNPQNLTELALQLTGEDVSALITDEALCGQVNDLNQMMAEITAGVTEETGLSPEELQQLQQEMKDTLSRQSQVAEEGVDTIVKPEVDADTLHDDGGEVKIVVERNGEVTELEMGTDGDGNTTSLKSAVTTGESAKEESAKDNKGADEQNSHNNMGNQAAQSENPLLNALKQDAAGVQEAALEQTTTFTSAQTQDIMNQIMDYMKIQLSPDINQLEMQLHPASLGTINVSIASREGVITAQFTAQDESIKAVLESKVQELTDTMRNQGIKVEAVEVTVESHAFESNLWQGQGQDQDTDNQPQKQKSQRRINLNQLDELPEELGQEEEIAVQMMQANGNTVDFTA